MLPPPFARTGIRPEYRLEKISGLFSGGGGISKPSPGTVLKIMDELINLAG